MFVKFDDSVAGNIHKSNGYGGDLKDFVLIETITKFQKEKRELLQEKELNFHSQLRMQ